MTKRKTRVYRQVRKRMPPKVKKDHGRPPHVPTEETRGQVATMCIAGVQQEVIARVLQISDVTLRKYYRDQIDTSLAQSVAMVARNVYNKAIGNGPQAMSAANLFLKCRGGWKETMDVNANHTGSVASELALPKGMTAKSFEALAKKLASEV